jgi:peptidoglycan hydrolase FlgJ
MDISRDIALMKMRQNPSPEKSIRQSTARGGEKEKYNRDLKKAADGFEELFVHKMLQVMRQSVPKTNLWDGGRGEEIFQDMLDENYAKIITKNKALGLSRVLYEQNKK